MPHHLDGVGASGHEMHGAQQAPPPVPQHHHHHRRGRNSGNQSSNQQSSANKPVKMKRTRQRVDAGEPRNSYASIANFSSRGGYHGYNHNKYGQNNQNRNKNNNNNNNNSSASSTMNNANSNNSNNNNPLATTLSDSNVDGHNSTSNNHHTHHHHHQSNHHAHHNSFHPHLTHPHGHHPLFPSPPTSNESSSLTKGSTSFRGSIAAAAAAAAAADPLFGFGPAVGPPPPIPPPTQIRDPTTAAAAMMMDGGNLFQQFCQNPSMAAALLSNAYTNMAGNGGNNTNNKNNANKFIQDDQFGGAGIGGLINAGQHSQPAPFNAANAYNDNPHAHSSQHHHHLAMFHQFINNLQQPQSDSNNNTTNNPLAPSPNPPNALFNPNFDAQLLRDILESGAAAGVGPAVAQQQRQQQPQLSGSAFHHQQQQQHQLAKLFNHAAVAAAAAAAASANNLKTNKNTKEMLDANMFDGYDPFGTAASGVDKDHYQHANFQSPTQPPTGPAHKTTTLTDDEDDLLLETAVESDLRKKVSIDAENISCSGLTEQPHKDGADDDDDLQENKKLHSTLETESADRDVADGNLKNKEEQAAQQEQYVLRAARSSSTTSSSSLAHSATRSKCNASSTAGLDSTSSNNDQDQDHRSSQPQSTDDHHQTESISLDRPHVQDQDDDDDQDQQQQTDQQDCKSQKRNHSDVDEATSPNTLTNPTSSNNMLLETVVNPHHHHHPHQRPHRGSLSPTTKLSSTSDDENSVVDHQVMNNSSSTKVTSGADQSSPKPQQQQTPTIVNGCKKRKLYQPQSTKMLNGGADNHNNNNNNNSLDISEEDDDEMTMVVDNGAGSGVDNTERNDGDNGDVAGVEDMVQVETELDEGYDETSASDKAITNGQNDSVNIDNKELDLTNSLTNHRSGDQSLLNNNSSSNVSGAKRARLDYVDQHLNKFQQQIYQKITTIQQQLLNNSQQQQSKSILNGGVIRNHHAHNQRTTSPVNLTAANPSTTNPASNECDITNNFMMAAAAAAAAAADVAEMKHQPTSSSSATSTSATDKFMYKISDVDSFVETVTGQILNSLTPIIGNSIRSYLEATQPFKTQQQQLLKESSHHGATDLLAQMLDAKYSRSLLLKNSSATTMASSPTNLKNSGGRDVISPYSMLPAASPAPKPFLVGAGAGYPTSAATAAANQASFYAGVKPNSAALYAAAAYSTLNGGAGVQSSGNHSLSSPPLPEQTEAMSLVTTKKQQRRNKVTDLASSSSSGSSHRLTPRTITRLPRAGDESIRETASVSPPSHNGPLGFGSAGHQSPLVPVSLASLQHANEFFDPLANNSTNANSATPSATTFGPFGAADPTAAAAAARLAGSFFTADDLDNLKNGVGLSNGGAGAANGASSDPSVVSAVAQAAAAHHFKLLAATAASRASPDSLNGYSGALLSSYGRGSGTGSENGGDGSETNDTQSIYDPSLPMTSTLSPMHLRKAKLMFFYVRYPSSSILKMFFPDIKFNKNNTAQLVKWFSNFREFYYIQMEKYARQALSEGVKSADDLHVTDDCELLRVLNLHYNRSNHIPIPENFRTVSETTLREFYKSLQQNKDTEQSWKKAIYKIIARLDDNVPEYFKNPNFMEQLE